MTYSKTRTRRPNAVAFDAVDCGFVDVPGANEARRRLARVPDH